MGEHQLNVPAAITMGSLIEVQVFMGDCVGPGASLGLLKNRNLAASFGSGVDQTVHTFNITGRFR